ncbi:Uncharacterised protein [Mycobacteroides abscessus subsp. abscessus]|nr:Uncharacterised protein [Mycobacteroides abscessus subsp. abscessus]
MFYVSTRIEPGNRARQRGFHGRELPHHQCVEQVALVLVVVVERAVADPEFFYDLVHADRVIPVGQEACERGIEEFVAPVGRGRQWNMHRVNGFPRDAALSRLQDHTVTQDSLLRDQRRSGDETLSGTGIVVSALGEQKAGQDQCRQQTRQHRLVVCVLR